MSAATPRSRQSQTVQDCNKFLLLRSVVSFWQQLRTTDCSSKRGTRRRRWRDPCTLGRSGSATATCSGSRHGNWRKNKNSWSRRAFVSRFATKVRLRIKKRAPKTRTHNITAFHRSTFKMTVCRALLTAFLSLYWQRIVVARLKRAQRAETQRVRFFSARKK